MSSFEPGNVFEFVLAWAWLAREKQNILTPQDVYMQKIPEKMCLMQTLLSANQSARS